VTHTHTYARIWMVECVTWRIHTHAHTYTRTHTHESCCTYEWVMSHMNESCHTYDWLCDSYTYICSHIDVCMCMRMYVSHTHTYARKRMCFVIHTHTRTYMHLNGWINYVYESYNAFMCMRDITLIHMWVILMLECGIPLIHMNTLWIMCVSHSYVTHTHDS